MRRPRAAKRIIVLDNMLLLLFAAVTVMAPESVRQGEVARLTVSEGAAVRLDQRTVPVFANTVLLPVAVDHPPGVAKVEVLNNQREPIHTFDLRVVDVAFPEQNIRVAPGGPKLEPLPGEMEAVRALRETVSGERHWEVPFNDPARGCMSSLFGVTRLHNGIYTGNYHRGVDIRSPRGRPIRAATAGVVRIARMFRLHGGTVGIDHGQGVTSLYIHMSRIAAKEGARVTAGQLIGYVGSTGFATGPHLHWGLYVHGVPVDPAPFGPKPLRCGN